jgi:hypothetical protein
LAVICKKKGITLNNWIDRVPSITWAYLTAGILTATLTDTLLFRFKIGVTS